MSLFTWNVLRHWSDIAEFLGCVGKHRVTFAHTHCLFTHNQLPRGPLGYLPPVYVDGIHVPGVIGPLIVVASSPALISCVTIPSELFSSLIPQKVLATFRSLSTPILYPYITDSIEGKWINHSINWWTSGFLPASSYLLLARHKMCNPTQSSNTSEADWLTLGRSSAGPLANLEATHGIGHDIGFISFPFVEELMVNPQNRTARDIVNRFAAMLAGRFNPVVGCTRSWDKPNPRSTTFTVIIDNMMNLELLFHSANLTGNSTLRQIAISHTEVTMRNHIRDDGSTWHVVDYNETTGRVIRKHTAQGYSDNSTWARGQAWAIYGFANMHRLTATAEYLETARKLATYFLNNLPQGGIVPWDFNAPLQLASRPADSSAAAIAASGLLLLAQGETDDTAKRHWIDNALLLLNNITRFAWNPRWQSLLSNGTANRPAGSYSTGIIYGDYYFIKAGNDLISMGLVSCSTNITTANTGISGLDQSSVIRLRVPFQTFELTSCLGYILLLFGHWVLGL